MIYDFLNNKDFLEARKNKQYYIFRNVIKENLTWEEIIKDIDLSLEKNYSIKTRFKFGIITHNAEEHIESVNNFLNAIHKLDPSLNKTAHIYSSFSKHTKDGDSHWDCSEVWYWQTIGAVDVEVGVDINKTTYNLQPGDIIYLPEGVFHRIISLTPRVGVSLGLDNNKKK
tara:strand:- start:813 stop:1322 length:510 start_codon:yes stop_codon:yes gene_type:complete